MSPKHKPSVWLSEKIKTPPFSAGARTEAGYLIRSLQSGIKLSMPESRPMPEICPKCHELRIADEENNVIWRIICRIDSDAIVITEIFAKKTQKTPKRIIDTCKERLKKYDTLLKQLKE